MPRSPVVQTLPGTWLVAEPEPVAAGRVVACCGVSSAGQRPDLVRQVACVVRGATVLRFTVAEVVTEVGSGLNGSAGASCTGCCRTRPPASWSWNTVIGSACFGVEHLQAALAASGPRLVVVDPE